MPEPRFGVVLLNWNGCDDTVAALESLIAAVPPPQHVVVVDNGSADDSVARLRGWSATHTVSWTETNYSAPLNHESAPWLVIITADHNLGFSGGNNVGLKWLAERTDCSHFLLLNNDAMVAPDYFARMSEALHAAPEAALLGCTIYRHPDRESVWFGGAYEIPKRALVLHRYTRAAGDEPRPTPFVTGCAMLISRHMYDVEGGLAQVYNPGYWEDSDYSLRARMHGWRVLLAPAARVYHRVGASGGGEVLTPRVAFLENRNRVIYVRRNYHGLDRAFALAYLAMTKPARSIMELMSGRGAIGHAIARGLLRGLTDPIT